ncbi:hypothetical protein C491_17404 [Natronococcus amylolyticus DSM 10524]|uniref:Uncharacterized protein n=1 Tax=Natronococcus amylolyticus DSM 10524 TaxID=1227497 RepID=L9X034_9EURY|nr:hypothetical protein [Natronococcus amylolyticus]ELY54987.1 hypothetical protein C491_17404 [Natronococcus amylolyticus DSM 10524]
MGARHDAVALECGYRHATDRLELEIRSDNGVPLLWTPVVDEPTETLDNSLYLTLDSGGPAES